MIFGARFRFQISPTKWKTAEKMEVLKAANLAVNVSNSRSTSGNLVIAGYILLKSPNTTHRQRYMQHLIRQLPENTPYFDIIRSSRTPMDQQIPHLVIQCGANHAQPLCQALLNYLTGKNRALFLPRHSFSAMTEETIVKQFEFHQSWLRSTVQLPLAPLVSHIDQPRREYFKDGTTLVRSTREWTETLRRPASDTPALCDIVNGNVDRKTYLVIPSDYLIEAKNQLKAYKARLSPPSRREARYRDSLPGLPNIIQISSDIQPNVSFVDQMSAAMIWSQAPKSVRDSTGPRKPRRMKNNAGTSEITKRRPSFLSTSNQSDTTIESIPEAPTANTTVVENETPSLTFNNFPPLASTPSRSIRIAIDNDDRSNTNTHSLHTRGSGGSMTTDQARFLEMDALIKRQQQKLESYAKRSDERLSAIERQFALFAKLDAKIDSVTTQAQKATTESQATTESLRTELHSYTRAIQEQNEKYQTQCDSQIRALGDSVLQFVTGMTQMRKEISRFSKMMVQHITPQPSPGPKRRKQRTQPPQTSAVDDFLPGVDLDVDMAQQSEIEMTLSPSTDGGDEHSQSDSDFIGPIDLVDTFMKHDDSIHPEDKQLESQTLSIIPRLDTVETTVVQEAATTPIPTSPSHATPPQSLATSPVLTPLPSLRRSQNTIRTYFSSAPLDPRNTPPTDPAGAHDK